jgi:hypothetical protein
MRFPSGPIRSPSFPSATRARGPRRWPGNQDGKGALSTFIPIRATRGTGHDDLAIRVLVRDLFEMGGYPVHEAANGAEALLVIRRARPCAVFLDMRMPVMDGWAFAQA